MLDESLRAQMMALVKINNLTGFLPLSIEEMLVAAMNELDRAFVPYKSEIKILKPWGLPHLLHPRKQCKAINDQLPIVIGTKQKHPCCKNNSCHCNCRWHVCVPLVAGKEAIGVITLKTEEDQELSRDSMEILLGITNQLAATIQRDSLFQRLAQEKTRLENANKEINGLNQALQATIGQLEKAQTQLILTERLAAAGQLAANVAHEINNPIGVIIGRLELLLLDHEHHQFSQEIIADLQVIKKHSERVARTTRNLLSFARPPQNDGGMVDLPCLIRETVAWLKKQFSSKGIEFVLHLEPIRPIEGNGEQLQQVLVNLFANARDAMSGGGTITVDVIDLAKDNMIRIDIRDTGPGIPETELGKLFDPFFTTKGKELGTGLGLPISFKIVGDHGGSMRVKSQPGQGSCFSIYLPSPKSDQKGG